MSSSAIWGVLSLGVGGASPGARRGQGKGRGAGAVRAVGRGDLLQGLGNLPLHLGVKSRIGGKGLLLGVVQLLVEFALGDDF
ncbi:hypothetical protein [Phaeovulum vinaykumarii]|uniref:hypothetical protein n=1 Tax=Phaeovulum vinaykumarii TaxID=407234 RepID=UPI00117BB151|nr:hypothetical protein [Phaeovulum vinaykumarii]